MKPIGNTGKRIYMILFFLITATLLALIVVGSSYFGDGQNLQLRSFSDGWSQDEGESYYIDNLKCGSFRTGKGLSKVLPADLTDGDSFCFSSQNVNLKVLLDSEEVYRFESRENLTGMGYGAKPHMIGLSAEDAGKTVTIQYWGVIDGLSGGKVYEVYLAPASDYLRFKVGKTGWGALFSILTCFFGIVLILIYFAIQDKDMLPFNVMALGIFALIMGIWLLVDTNLLQLMFGSLYIWRDISKTILFLIGYPLVVFVNSMTKLRRGIYVHLAFLLSVGSLAAIVIARYSYGVDMIRSFSRFLIVYVVILLLLIGIMLADNSYYCRMLGMKSSFRTFYIGVTVLLACAVVDLIIYFLKPIRDDSFGGITRIAMTVFVVLMLIRFLTWWTRDHKEVERDRFINRALQYAVSADSPENNIRALLRFLGNEFEARRIFIFEDQKNGKYRGTYEWFAEGNESISLDMLYLPFKGLVDELYDAFNKNDHKLIITNIEDYKNVNPTFYNVLNTNHADNLVLAPLEVNQNLIGVAGVVGAPVKSLEGIAEIISLISYFLAQLILQREEQKRMYYYTYNDALSGAMNHRAYRKFIDQGLDISAAFGYLCCSLSGLEEINKTYGYEAGDRIVVEVAECLMEVFGNENVYRLNGTDFSVFGFESEELFFENDVERARKMIKDRGIDAQIASLYCMYGTKNLNLVIQRVNDRLTGKA